MKATLEFDFTQPEDRMDHKRCIRSSDMAMFIWELKNNFWRKWKHDETDFTLDNYKDALYGLLQEYHIDIDDLIE